MADPFSIIALVGTSLKGILQARDFIDTIQRVPRSIETLGDELSSIAGLLRELGYMADGPDELNLNRIVREPLANCDKAAKHIERLIQPYVKTTGGITKRGRFAFGFKENDVSLLQRDLVACKQNLTLAVTSANLLTTRKVVRRIRRLQNHFGIATSSVAGADIDERNHEQIEEWIVETETVMEEEESQNLADRKMQPAIFSTPSNDEEYKEIPLNWRSPLRKHNDPPTFQNVTEPTPVPEEAGPMRAGKHRSSYRLPEDGSPVTMTPRRKKSDKDGHNSLNSTTKSQRSTLVEYIEGEKGSQAVSRRPSIRVKIAPSSKSRSRPSTDHNQITEHKVTRKPSYTKQIQLLPENL